MTLPSHRRTDTPETFVGLMAVLLRHPRLLVALPLTLALLAGVVALARGPRYVARAELKPQQADNRLAGFSGLAAQFGVNLGQLGTNDGVEFYAAVLRANEILAQVVSAEYRFSKRDLGQVSGDSMHGTLLDIWDIKGPTEAARLNAGVRRLRAMLTARPNMAAGLVRLEITARWPELAVQINRKFIEALASFNTHARQSQAAAQRVFVESRLAEKRAELAAAENALLAWQSRNRAIETPDLALEKQRLQRRVDVSQQVYMTLAQGYEQARIDEVRDTPVITVVDPPERTVEQSGGLLLFVALGGFVGLLIGLGATLLVELWARQVAAHPGDAGAMRSAWRELPRRLLGARKRHEAEAAD